MFGLLMGKKRLLYISAVIPESTGGGSEMRAASHIDTLSELFDITLAIVSDCSEVNVHKRVATGVKRACVSLIVISRISVINGLRQQSQSFWARALLRGVMARRSVFRSLAIAELGRRLATEAFDVVHCFRLDTGILRLLRRHGIRIDRQILDLDDYQSQVQFRSATVFRTTVGNKFSAATWLNAVKWWVLEALLIPRFDDVLVCSELDWHKLCRRFPGTRWHVVPNTVAEPKFRPTESDRFTFLFVGRMGYFPNWDAILFFCMQILPLLRRMTPREFRVLIVGRARNASDLDRLRAIEDVRVVLDPLDLSPYYAQSDVAIVPIRSGGGTRIKILEAFSYGLPVISTTIGAEGLDVTPGSNIIIADSAEAFAEQCLRIWTDDLLRRRIAAAGRELWRKKYSPIALVAAFNAVYQPNGAFLIRHCPR